MAFRYIEVFRSSMHEAQKSQAKDLMRGSRNNGNMMRGRPGPYDRNGPGSGRGPQGRGSRNFKSM